MVRLLTKNIDNALFSISHLPRSSSFSFTSFHNSSGMSFSSLLLSFRDEWVVWMVRMIRFYLWFWFRLNMHLKWTIDKLTKVQTFQLAKFSNLSWNASKQQILVLIEQVRNNIRWDKNHKKSSKTFQTTWFDYSRRSRNFKNLKSPNCDGISPVSVFEAENVVIKKKLWVRLSPRQ